MKQSLTQSVREGFAAPLRHYPGIFVVLIAFLLPFQTFGPVLRLNLVPILIGIWGMIWILDMVFRFRSFTWRPVPSMVWQVLFVLITMLGLLWSTNIDAGMTRVQVRMSLFAIPLYLAGKELGKKDEIRLLNAFLLANLMASLFCLLHALPSYFGGDTAALYYTEFSYFLHPSYFSLFLIISAAALILRDDLLIKRAWLRLFLLAWIILILYFLSSRAGLISGAVILISAALFFPSKAIFRARFWIAGMITLLFVAAWLGNYRSSPAGIEERSTLTAGKTITMPESPDSHSNSLRMMVWESSLSRIKGAWAIGYGTGDAQDQLLEEYTIRGFTVPLEKKLNSHSQYFDVLLETGIPGLIVLLWMLLAIGWRAISRRNLLVVVVIALYGFNFLMESMLNTQAGTISFALFLSVLPAYHYREKKQNIRLS